ncbi:MAG: aspartyl/asparaginyl beta-hydroxylase domain-containing protein [Proteobacteria bacterium]|nr:aspartyl/asparaginyl beta-hydroxylase domain-containing protein [Pseudomonadota bacterium]
MKLANEFIRLPLKFDADRLAEEVLAFDSSEWMPHVQSYAGNSSIPLISLNGEMNDDFNGPMKVTEKLQRSPYIRQILASFGEVFGRSRLMGLDGRCSVPEHRDVNYHWYSRVRIHIPVISNPDVLFYCGDTHVHMAPGEAWIFDSWQRHRVENNSDQFRVHLVIDTAGSPNFWHMVGASEWRCAKQCRKPASVQDRVIPYAADFEGEIQTESYNAPLVMGPGEVDALIMDIVSDLRAFSGNPAQQAQMFEHAVQDFRYEWRRLWSIYGQSSAGWPHYERLIKNVQMRMPRVQLTLASNQGSATHTFGQRVLAAALSVSLAEQYGSR